MTPDPRPCQAQFKNGDQWTGQWIREDNKIYWIAQDSNGRTYETDETPIEYIDLTNAEIITVYIGV